MIKAMSKPVLMTLWFCCVPLLANAEHSFPIINWIKDGREDQREVANSYEANYQASIPAVVDLITAMDEDTTRRYLVYVPRSPNEAMEMLDDIAEDMKKLTYAVGQFGRSKKMLTLSLDRMTEQSQRNRNRISGWTPVLLGDLRLLRASNDRAVDDLWLMVALIILEKQVERADLHLKRVASSDKVMSKLREREADLERRRDELLAALKDIRQQLIVIRRRDNLVGNT